MSESKQEYPYGADTAWVGGVFLRDAPDISSFVMHAPAALCSAPASPLSDVYNKQESAEVVSATSQATAPTLPLMIQQNWFTPQRPANHYNLYQSPAGPPTHPTESGQIWNQCNCKRSQCVRKYCVCFAANLRCNNSCNCQGCKNQEGEVVNMNPNPLTIKKLQNNIGKPSGGGKSKKRPRQLDLNEEQQSNITKDQLWLLFQSISQEEQSCHLRAMHHMAPASIQDKFKELQHHNE